MKILAVHSYTNGKPGNPVDLWRIYRPLRELGKHTDWQIDHSASVITRIDEYKNSDEFAEVELEKAAEQLKDYDIIFISYWNLSAHIFAMLHAVKQRYGTQLVVDLDDDVYDIPYDNPIWLKTTPEKIDHYKQIMRLADYVTTTNEHLAKKVRHESQVNARVFVLPNYIADDYKHDPIDNGDDLVIGYFGGASHYRDLHRTGVFPALQKLMHEHKNIRFECVGQPIDFYLPRARSKVTQPVRGMGWIDTLFPLLNFDIAIAPLQDTEFAKGKSNIKWQEATRMGAAVVCSDVGPYAALPDGVATKVPNTQEAWYMGLQTLVEDKKARQKQLAAAQTELSDWRLEDHWKEYKNAFEEVQNANDTTSTNTNIR